MKTEGRTRNRSKDGTDLTIRMDRFEESPHLVGLSFDNEPIEYAPIPYENYLSIKARAFVEGRDPGEIVAEAILKGLEVE